MSNDEATTMLANYEDTATTAFGFIGMTLYNLVYTERASVIREISLRKATKQERTKYTAHF